MSGKTIAHRASPDLATCRSRHQNRLNTVCGSRYFYSLFCQSALPLRSTSHPLLFLQPHLYRAQIGGTRRQSSPAPAIARFCPGGWAWSRLRARPPPHVGAAGVPLREPPGPRGRQSRAGSRRSGAAQGPLQGGLEQRNTEPGVAQTQCTRDEQRQLRKQLLLRCFWPHRESSCGSASAPAASYFSAQKRP
ncbi:hypothetical protein NDU88_008951 [Pleurodeles waltl]|uniref:Uncharacterized protein n=1 Tax=Pleurodeles waltl TaxID=8319 RepID=A0AAV7PUH2_PLEWA|nr:hypothetical protein NDU88_008951 [Pleurodeles waltl]